MGISKFNKGNKIDWGIDTKSMPFKKTAEVELNKTYDLKGCFITPDRGYGEGAVLISDGFLLNIPARYLDNIKNIISDPEAVEEIKSGKCGFVVTSFISEKFKRTGYSIEFVEK